MSKKAFWIITLPRGFKHLWLKFWLPRILKGLGIGQMTAFACFPNCEQATLFFPMLKDSRICRKLICGDFGGAENWRKILKGKIKLALGINMPLFGLFYGVMIIAKEREKKTKNEGDCIQLNCDPFILNHSLAGEFWVWQLKVWSGKRIGLLYESKCETEKIKTACKVTRIGNKAYREIENEFTNLKILNSYKDALKVSGILIPEPIRLERKGEWLFSFE